MMTYDVGVMTKYGISRYVLMPFLDLRTYRVIFENSTDTSIRILLLWSLPNIGLT